MQRFNRFCSDFAKFSRNFSSLTSKNNTENDSVDGKVEDYEWIPKDIETHTGQIWDKNDYRMVRFIDKPKQVNTKFAIELIDKVAPAPSRQRVVWCDGGNGPLGHPRVYINLDKPGNHTCGYCGLRFYKVDKC